MEEHQVRVWHQADNLDQSTQRQILTSKRNEKTAAKRGRLKSLWLVGRRRK
jgi:hypothetical protein